MSHERTKIKSIADLPLEERRRLLEAAAERAASDYQSDNELIAFTELDDIVHDWPADR